MRGKTEKIICVDGKMMRSNKRNGSKPRHIVSAWSCEDGYCLGQKAVEEKSNEITAIPNVLDAIEIKGQAVTIGANGYAEGDCRKDPEKTCGLCAGGKRESGKSVLTEYRNIFLGITWG